MFSRALQKYSDATQKWPYRTNIAMAGFLWFSGDIISQLLEGRRFVTRPRKDPHSDEKVPQLIEWKRVFQMTTYGILVAGPIYTWWYRLLDRKTIHLKEKSMWKYLGTKLFVDQFIFEIPYLTIFFSINSFAEGKNFHQIVGKIKQDLLPTFFVDCQVWPLAQFLNFRFLPAHHQALFVNSMCVGWNAYLSFVQHREKRPESKVSHSLPAPPTAPQKNSVL